MKRNLIFLMLILMVTACNRVVSTMSPTEPAKNIPVQSSGKYSRCQPSDLETSSNSINTTSEFIIGVTLSNKTNQICLLSNPPKIQVLDSKKNLLDLQISDMPPVQTPPAPAEIQLAPGENVILTIMWENVCQTSTIENVNVRLDLASEKILDVEVKLEGIPSCIDKNKPTTISVAPYSVPP